MTDEGLLDTKKLTGRPLINVLAKPWEAKYYNGKAKFCKLRAVSVEKSFISTYVNALFNDIVY